MFVITALIDRVVPDLAPSMKLLFQTSLICVRKSAFDQTIRMSRHTTRFQTTFLLISTRIPVTSLPRNIHKDLFRDQQIRANPGERELIAIIMNRLEVRVIVILSFLTNHRDIPHIICFAFIGHAISLAVVFFAQCVVAERCARGHDFSTNFFLAD